MNIEIESSYKKNNLGKTIYEIVIKYRPKKIIDFGVLNGYSTICMAKALNKLKRGKIYAYDLWDKYPYKHTTIEVAKKNIEKYDLLDYVILGQKDFFEWIKSPSYFDLLHIDISNDGKIIEYAYNKLLNFIEKGSIIIFEGGTKERDREEWMVKYNKKFIFPLKDKIKYKIINYKWPGLSIIKK